MHRSRRPPSSSASSRLPRSIPAVPVVLWIAIGLVAGAEASAVPEAPPGRAALDEFLRRQVRSISERCLAGIETADDWLAARRRLRAELKEMLGLEPEPPRGDLRAAVTGTIERRDLGIAIEKVCFQSVPGLYVTGSFYRPIEVRGRLPTILYLCGHGQVKVDGVSYGNKAHYFRHPAWFARNGYACLILDTLQLGEIEGKHHGTYRLGMWWWVSRGYTPAGVEAWNSIRALDWLETRPEVDPGRIGVTGRSGGGIGTWWLAALDDRPAALVPVAGITDLENHVVTGCIDGHCDCNYPVNLYGMDYPAIAALAAPRPLLLANSDKDGIFPLDGVLRVHGALRRVYRLLGAEDRLGLCIVDGPHADTQELQVPAFRWMARWLEGEKDRVVQPFAEGPFDPRVVRVLDRIPDDQRNTTIEETFVPPAETPPVPATREAFEDLAGRLRSRLLEKTFARSPDPGGPPGAEALETIERDGARLRRFRFASEEPFRLEAWMLSGAGAGPPSRVVLRVLDEAGWKAWSGALAGPAPLPRIEEGTALVGMAPRGVGPTRWSDSEKRENQVRRRFLALGRTVEEARVHDVRRAVRMLRSVAELSGADLEIEARGEMAGVALYAAILEPAVSGLALERLPASHREGVALLNVLRTLDLPQAASLVFPRRVRLSGVDPEAFAWTRRAAKLFADPSGRSPLELAAGAAGAE